MPATFTTASMTLSEMPDYTNFVLGPVGNAAIFRGPIGMGKSVSTIDNILLQQSLDPDFGGCAYVMASAESIDVRGFPLISQLRSQFGMPPWLWPVPALGLRGAFPALCPKHLRGDSKTWSPALRKAYETADEQIAAAMRGEIGALIPYRKGIICLDEVLQVVEETALLPLASLLLEHRVGEWGVPLKGWAIVGLTNRITDQAGVRELFAHVRNRVAIYDVDHDQDGTADYWQKKGLNLYFRYFPQAEPQSVFTTSIPTTGGAGEQDQFTTPRSWHMAHDECMAWLSGKEGVSAADLPSYQIPADSDRLRSFIAARCGVPTAGRFSDFLRNMHDRPSFKSIVADPAKAKLPGNSGVIRAVVRMCVEGATTDNLARVCAYMGRADMSATNRALFCQQLVRRFTVSTLFADDAFSDLVDLGGPTARNLLYVKKS